MKRPPGTWLKDLPYDGQTISNDFTLGPYLGSGAFASVILCHIKRDSRKLWACKITLKPAEKQDHENVKEGVRMVRCRTVRWFSYVQSLCFDRCQCTQELKIYKRLGRHAHISQLGSVYENPESVSFMLAYASKGRLMPYLASWATISEEQIAFLLDQLLKAVVHCHSHGVVHLDVKPENVLVLDGEEGPRVLLANFGLSECIMPGEKFSGFVGTETYAAPEVMLNQEYDEKADIFSFGVLASQVLMGRSCIVGRHGTNPGKCNLSRRSPARTVSVEGLAFLKGVLDLNPETRLSASAARLHPFIRRTSLFTGDPLTPHPRPGLTHLYAQIFGLPKPIDWPPAEAQQPAAVAGIVVVPENLHKPLPLQQQQKAQGPRDQGGPAAMAHQAAHNHMPFAALLQVAAQEEAAGGVHGAGPRPVAVPKAPAPAPCPPPVKKQRRL